MLAIFKFCTTRLLVSYELCSAHSPQSHPKGWQKIYSHIIIDRTTTDVPLNWWLDEYGRLTSSCTLPCFINMDLTKDQVIEILRVADAVCFDVDSTICQDEGIDELAKYYGVGDRVKQLTTRAMDGNMTFQEALSERIKIINPTYIRLKNFLETRSTSATPGAKELVDKLRNRGVDIYLVSGGFAEIISPTADMLGIPRENIKANRFLYYYSGECVGADERMPTCRSGGKAQVISQLREEKGYKMMVMIGDGATDLEACPPADAFIGFGGNIVRQLVKDKASWFVHSFQEIIEVLGD